MKRRNRVHKQVLALLLSLALVFQSVVQAGASIADTLHNSLEQNQSILQQLEGMYGGNLTQTDVEQELKNMGLLGDDGNLTVSENVMVDGTPMTLEQVKALIAKPGTDLSKTVSVDGTKVTLANLQTMIKIEDELKRLKETYLTGAVPFDDARKKSYASLQTQLQSTGLNMGELLSSSQQTINQDARIKVTLSGRDLTASLVNTAGTPISALAYDVTFKYRALPGTFTALSDTSEKTVTISAGSTSATVSNNDLIDDFLTDGAHCSGARACLLEVYGPTNALFYEDGGHTNLHSYTFSLVNKQMYRNYSWTTTATYQNATPQQLSSASDISDPVAVLGFLKTDADNIVAAGTDLFGAPNAAWFHIKASLYMALLYGGPATMNAIPVLKAGTAASPQNITNVSYFNGSGYVSSLQAQYPVHKTDTSGNEDAIVEAKAGGAIPTLLVFSPVSGTSVTYSPTVPSTYNGNANFIGYYSIINTVSIDSDSVPSPAVSAVTAPAGTYTSGMQIPITVKFTQPVTGSPKLIMKDGTALSPVESSAMQYSSRSYLYTVPASPDAGLMYKEVDGITNIMGKTTAVDSPNGGNGDTVAGVTMEVDRLLAFQGLSVTNAPAGGTFPYNGTVGVTLTPNTAYSKWLDDEAGQNGGKLTSACVMANGKACQLSTDDEGKTYKAAIPAANYMSADQTALSIDLYSGGTYANGSFTGGAAVFGQHAEAVIAPIVPVTGVTIHEPTNHTIYTTGTTAVRLTADAAPSTATFPQIEWSSSDGGVATIDASTGVITPVSPGTVTFTATAHNNGVPGAGAVTQTSSAFTISNDGIPAITFPSGANTFYTRKGESARIFWGQNLIGREGSAARPTFTIAVYAGKFAGPADVTGAPVYSASVTNQSSFTIPENVFSQVSSVDADQNITPSYTVKVGAPDPDDGT